VCDGMGGHVGGQVASQLAVATLAEVIRGNNPPPGADEPDRLVTAIRCANVAVFTKARAEPSLHNMGTTVVAVRQEDDLLHICHVGDSRIYRLRAGQLEQVTRDHSLINLYAENPELATRFGPPNSNVIVRAVGLRENVDVDHRVIAMEPGDLYLLCCDGLTDMVDDWVLKEILVDRAKGSLDDTCETLIKAALANGGVDNTTAILLRAAG
jgi:serine/threonine protein phosphatase PrpC